MSADRKPTKSMHQIFLKMMQQGITITMFHDCTVEDRYYTPMEYTNLTNIQRFKLSLISNATNRPPGSYDTFAGTFPARHFNPAN